MVKVAGFRVLVLWREPYGRDIPSSIHTHRYKVVGFTYSLHCSSF